ncbi:DUF5906 domain-containing protein [Rhizobium arsenicireducens]
MFGKILNFAGELSETRPVPGDVFKKVISGEDLTVQYKNQNPFHFEPECAHWFNSNHLPKTRDSSEGFNRRWLILEFNNRIAPTKQIADLDQQILEHEREAIVAWAIQGYRRLVDLGAYTMPASHLALVDQMAADNNSVRAFLTSPGTVLKWGAERHISLPELHTEYWRYMLATGGQARVNVSKFASLMKELSGDRPFYIEIRGKNEVFYLGLGI